VSIMRLDKMPIVGVLALFISALLIAYLFSISGNTDATGLLVGSARQTQSAKQEAIAREDSIISQLPESDDIKLSRLDTRREFFRAHLRSLLRKGKLQLSQYEARELELVYVEAFSALADIESKLLRFEALEGATAKFRIPPFPDEGSIIRDMFYERLAQRLSAGTVKAVTDVLAVEFDTRLKAFGFSEQLIAIERVLGYEPYGQYKVTWKVKNTQVALNNSDPGSKWTEITSVFQGPVDQIDKSYEIDLGKQIRMIWPTAR